MAEPQGGIPEEVRALLEGPIDSIAQLEILLVLQRTAPDAWSAEELSAELRIEQAWAAEQLERLRERQLLARLPGPGSYRFEPATPELMKAVQSLAACYADRRVSVVALLYSRASDQIRGFAGAFRIRREGSDG
jgi:hypothetical protein